MRIFVTGATGFIGSALVPELMQAGHDATGLARSDAAAAALVAAGAHVHRGSLEDLDSLRRGAEQSDGVIHCAFIHDFTRHEQSGATDRRAIEALGATLAGSGRPLVITSGTAILTPGRVGTERDAPAAGGLSAVRGPSEEVALALAAQDVRCSIVRLPPSVHGEGDHGFVPALIGLAKARGVSAFIGDGGNRWAAVHRLDAVGLFRLSLEQAPAGTILHGVGDEGVPTREIAELIGRHLQLPVVAVTAADANGHFGWLGGVFSLDVPASSAHTRERMGWQPGQPGLIADLDEGHYFGAVAATAGA